MPSMWHQQPGPATPSFKLRQVRGLQSPLAAVQEPIRVETEQMFDQILRDARVPVLVDFWAEWCGPCRAAAPHVQATAQNMQGRALVLKVDTEELPALASRFSIRSIPNFMVFKAGAPVMQQAGLVDNRQMEAWLARA